MVIAPTIGWRFPATEHPWSLWMGIWMLLLQMMLTGESNEPLKGGWEPNAELTPFLQKKNQPFARWLVAVHVFLTPPVEQRSQLTLSAQWSSLHWMVEVLQCNNLTDHGICFFLRTDSWDPMSRVNVHSCSPKHWTSCVHWLIFRGWSFNPVVHP